MPRFPSYIGVRPDAVAKQPQTVAADPSSVAELRRVDVRRRISPEEPQDAPPKSPISVGVAAAAKPRYFEFVAGASSKFWEISQGGNAMTTRWGRIGSAGQSKTKTFADQQAAANAMAVLIEEKTDEGYAERPG